MKSLQVPMFQLAYKEIEKEMSELMKSRAGVVMNIVERAAHLHGWEFSLCRIFVSNCFSDPLSLLISSPKVNFSLPCKYSHRHRTSSDISSPRSHREGHFLIFHIFFFNDSHSFCHSLETDQARGRGRGRGYCQHIPRLLNLFSHLPPHIVRCI